MQVHKNLSSVTLKLITRTGIRWPGWCNLLIWKTGAIILIALTINDFIPLFNEYMKNNVATQIRVVSHDSKVKPPSVTLCIPRIDAQLQKVIRYLRENRTSKCDVCEKMARHSWDIWDGMDFDNVTEISEYRNLLSAAFIANLITIGFENDFQILHVNNSDWNQPIVESVWNFFSCLTMIDLLDSVEDKSDRNWCPRIENVDLLLSNKLKMEKLFERVANILSENIIYFYPLELRMWGDDQSRRVASIYLKRSMFYYDSYCILLPLLEKGSAILVNGTSEYGVWSAFQDAGSGYYFCSDPTPVTWPLGSVAATDTLYQSGESGESVFITSTPALTVREGRSNVECYENSRVECKGKCMITKIVQICGCIPFSFRSHVVIDLIDTSYCNVSYYSQCKINKSAEFEKCDRKCNNPCEYTNYQWHISRGGYGNKSTKQYYVRLQPLVSPYIEFTATQKNTQEQFLSQIGAVFNFYLGFSGLSFIALLIYCVEASRKYLTKKSTDQSDTSNQSNEEIIIGQQLPRQQNSNFEMRSVSRIDNRNFSDQTETLATKREMGELQRRLEELIESKFAAFRKIQEN